MATGTIRERIGRALGAGAFGQAVTILVQLVSVPLFLQYWGIERYGEWLILAAIPSYLALSDLGFGSAAANEMTMAAGAGDHERVVATYQSTCALLGVIVILLLLLVPPIALIASQSPGLGIRAISHADVFWVVVLLGSGVAASLAGGIISAVYRCEGRYATGAVYTNLLRLAEFAVTAAALAAGCKAVGLAAAIVCARCLGMATIYGCALRFAPWSRVSLRHARRARVRALAGPALSFMAFPVGNAINQQGFSLLIGTQLGSAPLVVFSTMRTVSRVASQAMNLINSAVWPELSRAFGRQDVTTARDLHRRAVQASVVLAIGALGALSVAGSDLLRIWTHGKVVLDNAAYPFLLAAMAVNAVWFTSSVVPASVNRHQRMALVYVAFSCMGLLLAILLARGYGLAGAAAATLIIELGMASFVLPNSLALTEDRFADFCGALTRWPAYLGGRANQI
jgi:O-antigen/teichoic acid export membrane protein